MGVKKEALISESSTPSARVEAINNWINQNITGITSELIESYMHEDVAYICAKITLNNNGTEILFGYEKEPEAGHLSCEYGIYYAKKNTDDFLIQETVTHTSNKNVADVSINAYIDDNCIVFAINELFDFKLGCELIVVNCENSIQLVGYYDMLHSAAGIQYVDISSLTFKQINDVSNISYTYTNMFMYVAPAPTIDFLGQAYFVNNGVKKFTTDILRECSTVNTTNKLETSISLVDGTYIALGKHCLAPLEV